MLDEVFLEELTEEEVDEVVVELYVDELFSLLADVLSHEKRRAGKENKRINFSFFIMDNPQKNYSIQMNIQ